MEQLERDRHHELAEFLRSRRARITPEQVGLPRGPRRRTPGLRRAEVALLAGVSPDWYAWLEQGRDINISGQLLERLASALQLNTSERAYIFWLALRQSPPAGTFSPSPLSPTILQFLHQLGNIPACIVDSRLTALTWNDAFCAVFGDYAILSERERNIIWRMFAYSGSKQFSLKQEALARQFLAQFRSAYGRFIHDPWWAELIAELSQRNPNFQKLWASQDVTNMTEGSKSFCHPVAGELSFDFTCFPMLDAGDLRLLVYVPQIHSDTTEKIEQLLTAGV